MLIDSNSMISITEANQDFTTEARKADNSGRVNITKNDKPAHILSPSQEDELHSLPDQEILNIGSELLDAYKDDFLKMAE